MKPDTSPYESNIIKYYLNVFLFEMSLWVFLAVHIIYLQQLRGLNLTRITLIGAAYWIVACFAEIPTGVVADRFSRKLSLAISAVLTTLAILAYGFSPNFILLILSNVLLAIALSFQSGADAAFFYETLKALDRQDEYPKWAGRTNAAARGGMISGSIIGGWLGAENLLFPFILGAFLHLLLLGITLTLIEPPKKLQQPLARRKGYGEIIRKSIRIMKEKQDLRNAVFYFSIIPIVSFEIAVVFIQPQAVSLGIPIGSIGMIMMGMHLSKAGGVLSAYRFRHRFGERSILYAVPALLFVCLVYMGIFQTTTALWAIALVAFSTDVTVPIINHVIQREIFDDVRATLLSMQNMLFSLLIAITEPLLGATADHFTLSGTYFVMALILFAVCIWLFSIRKKWLR